MTKLIVLTGSSRGLGLALYAQLMELEQIKLIGLSRTINAEQQQRLSTAQGRFDYIELDLATAIESGFESSLQQQLEQRIGGTQFAEMILINNAGVIDPIGMVGQLPEEAIRQSTCINFVAPMMIAQVLQRLAESRSLVLKVINISSGAANHAISGWPVYCASKAALQMFFDVMALMPGCVVKHIDPGVLNTQMQTQIREASEGDFPDVESFRAMQQQGQLVEPDIIARKIVDQLF